MEQKTLLKVSGMDCANCALTISRTLKKDGLKDVNVDFLTGEVTFNQTESKVVTDAITSIKRLGYKVENKPDEVHDNHDHGSHAEVKIDWKFFISLAFTLPLLLHMILPFAILHEPIFQLIVCLPVITIGILHFGKSAYYSLRAGFPNMDVLIFIGSFAAFAYSIAGIVMYYGSIEVQQYLFFETSATIITLVLLGNLIEQRSVKRTTSAITQLSKLQPRTARKLMVINGKEEIIDVQVESLKKGDVIQVNSGDNIPCDGSIISGKVLINESMLTGESVPLSKTIEEKLTGGTLVEDGSARIIVEQLGKEMVLSQIIEMVRKAQHSKPEIQKLGDKISAIFVPAVIIISLLTFLISFFFIHIPLSKALMNSIAVLVISCPCAMGLATPTAVMVGLGIAARNGILIKGGSTIEQLARIKTIVFDKTGTLTTGEFSIKKINSLDSTDAEIRSILYSLETHSSHPIARSIQKELKSYSDKTREWKSISEDKGIGINAIDKEGNLYSAGSFQMVKHFHSDLSHDIYLLKNNKLIAEIDLEDQIKEDSAYVVKQLKQKGIRVIMLSGDRKNKCESVAERTGIKEIYYEKMPAQKLEILEKLVKENVTAMIGDGINDAPSLSKADVGISISNASDIAIQSAQVVLLSQNDFHILLKTLRIGELIYSTIKQNLFWAFLYNIIAIPIAATGFLSPMIGALSMAFSDVIVIGNSLRLRSRKI